ncbi:hypothetical protein VPNG_05203 [Cytospora leucostoma]|uniref:Ketoreductase (KR) domain-containing protein n=1 Tax=Cytospora leucostoma TaxID=1230097 RepID=A0A423X7K1_9PEZI|nr:hypothetical protein VPNG_05203 [Cytospora leucostoma]
MSSTLEDSTSWEATLFGGIQRQFTSPKPLPANTGLDGQVAIVTGSNGGLGLEACRQLLKHRLTHLVIAVRSKAGGEAAANQLRQEFPDPRITIDVWLINMESYDSIQQFVDQVWTLSRIDVVILNAAAVMTTATLNPSTGHESTMQVNYLSTALLAILLLPILKSSNIRNNPSRPPVLSLVGSDLMYTPDFAPKIKSSVLPQYDTKENFETFAWYAGSKLLLVFFVSRLAELVDPADVLINVPNPGLTRYSGLDRYASLGVRTFMKFFRLTLGRSLETSASIYLDAVLVRGPESHGSFISDWEIKP